MTDYDTWLHAQEDAAWGADEAEDESPPFPSEPPEWWWSADDHDSAGRDADEAMDAWREERWSENDFDGLGI